MSYILDALKKIDREKNRKSPTDGRIRIAGDLFHERQQPAPHSAPWKVVAVVLVASMITAAGTWYMLKGKNNSVGVKTADYPQQLSAGVPVPPPLPVRSALPVKKILVPAPQAVPAPVQKKPVSCWRTLPANLG